MEATLYQDENGTVFQFEGTARRLIKVIFVQTKIEGDYNKITYSQKKLREKRGETRKHVYFIPGDNEKQIKAELHRGHTFFSARDGVLFGAYHELTKLGKFVEFYAF